MLKLLTYRLAVRPLRTTADASVAVPAVPMPVAPPIGMHPHALDLADGRRLGSHLGLEHHLAAFEAGPRAARGDQSRHPAPVAAAAVTDPRVDADLADEHVDGRDQVGVEFVDADLAHGGVDRADGRCAQRHQRLVLAHVARRTPGVLESLPHRQHHLGAADQRRATPRRAHRLVGERIHIVGAAAQRDQIRPCVTEGFGRSPSGPQLAADRRGLDSVFGDPRGDHAAADRILVEHAINVTGVAHHRHPSLVDEAK